MAGTRIFTDGKGYFTQRGTGGGVPNGDTYVLGTQDPANLPNSVANPTAYYGADAQPAAPGTLDDEFNGVFNLSRWTWVNQSTATVANSNSLATITQPTPAGGGHNNNCLVQPVPAASWQVVLKMNNLTPPATANRAGIVLTNGLGTPALTQVCIFTNGNSSTVDLLIQNYTNPTTFVSTSVQSAIPSASAYWFSAMYDGTNLFYYLSYDGVNFWNFKEDTPALFLTPTYVGFFIDPTFTAVANTGGHTSTAGATYGTSYASFDYFRRIL